MCKRDENSDDFEMQLMNVKTRKASDVSWVDVQGVPDQDGRNRKNEWEGVFVTESVPDLREIRLRDPNTFVAGGLHLNPRAWEVILRDHPQAELILDWIQNQVSITRFASPFEGSFKGCPYNSCLPPGRVFLTIVPVTSSRILYRKKS